MGLLLGAVLPLMCAIVSAQGAGGDTVKVYYAGSLLNVMEHGIGPAFDREGGGRFQGVPGGSNKLASEIKNRAPSADVFISANPHVNEELMGSANGDLVSWYVAFAESPLVIGYNPSSRFAEDFKSKPWYEVLQQPGIRIGRTDPKLDPKGQLTLDLLQKAAQVYKTPNLSQKILGAPENQAQIFPEQDLVSRLQSGKLDVGFFYSTETARQNISAIKLPPETALGAHYTATVLKNASNPAGADGFLAFLLGPEGRKILERDGLELVTPAVEGNAQKAPASMRSAINAGK
jgi:molybdate/tungstate transport system substrate-binding protein